PSRRRALLGRTLQVLATGGAVEEMRRLALRFEAQAEWVEALEAIPYGLFWRVETLCGPHPDETNENSARLMAMMAIGELSRGAFARARAFAAKARRAFRSAPEIDACFWAAVDIVYFGAAFDSGLRRRFEEELLSLGRAEAWAAHLASCLAA